MNRHEHLSFTALRIGMWSILGTLPAVAGAAQFRAVDPPQISGGARGAIASSRQRAHAPILTGRHEVPEAIVNPLALTNIFEGPWFDDNLVLNDDFLAIPPDPIGAAGPQHVISVVNSVVEARTKSGAQLWIESLEKFLRVEDTPLDEGIFPFDPKILYDSYRNRFVVVGLELDPNTEQSRIILAVSKDSTPTGPGPAHWYVHRINAKTFASGVGNCFADYPGFEVDEEAIYVTAIMFAFDLTGLVAYACGSCGRPGFIRGARLQ